MDGDLPHAESRRGGEFFSRKERIDRKGWKRVRLEDVCEISKGKQLNRTTLAEKGRIPVYNGGSSPSGYTEVSNTDAENVIISEGGNSCGFINFIHVPFWRGGHCYLLKTKINKSLLYYVLKANEPKIMALRVGTGLPNIQRKRLNAFEFDIPTDNAEQKQLVSAFTSIDTHISALQSLIAKYEAIKKATVNLLLRPRHEITLVKLSDVAYFSTETIKTNEIDTKWYVGTENMLANCAGVAKNNTSIQYPRVRSYCQGDILISNIRPYLKKIWLADRDGGCSTDVNVIRCKSTELLYEYLYFVLSQDCFFEHIMRNAIGTKMPRGDKAVIGDFEFFLPTINEQDRIVHALKELDAMICNAKYQLVKMEHLKQGMMSYFFG